MEPEHQAHLARVLKRVQVDVATKYVNGQAEHGGELWLQPGLLREAYAEALDLVVYLATLLEQEERRR